VRVCVLCACVLFVRACVSMCMCVYVFVCMCVCVCVCVCVVVPWQNSHGVFMHLHFVNFSKFKVLLSSSSNDEIDLTVVVRIDPLKRGASCACGRKNESS